MDQQDKKSANNAAEVIGHVFRGLSPKEIAALLKQAAVRTYPSGTTLCHEGCHEDVFYILLDGEVEITVKMPDGNVRRLAQVPSGNFFGEMALIDDNPRAASVTTVSESTLAEISNATFKSMFSNHPLVATAILKRVSANLRATDQATIADLSRQNEELQRALRELKEAQDELAARARMARDLEIAAKVQQSLLPQEFAQIPGWSIHGCNIPALEVSGDYFDVIPLDNGKIALVLADVAGKSVQAALYMAMLRTLFVAESRNWRSPKEALLAVHRRFYEAGRYADTFATAFYGVLDPKDGSFRYARGGHELPLLIRARGDHVESLEAKGRFIGMVEDLELEECETTINPGDLLMIYSDGLPDAFDSEYRHYRLDRFQRILQKHEGMEAKEVCDRALKDVDRHRGEAPIQDDITLLAVKRLA